MAQAVGSLPPRGEPVPEGSGRRLRLGDSVGRARVRHRSLHDTWHMLSLPNASDSPTRRGGVIFSIGGQTVV
jgi:hypothetical protein